MNHLIDELRAMGWRKANALGRFWIEYGWLIVFCLLVGAVVGLFYVGHAT